MPRHIVYRCSSPQQSRYAAAAETDVRPPAGQRRQWANSRRTARVDQGGRRVHIEGAGAADKPLARLLLTDTQLRQQRRHFGGGARLNLPAVLVVEIADAQQAALTQEPLRPAAFI